MIIIIYYYYYYYYYYFNKFYTPIITSGYHWSLTESKSPYHSMILLSIRADLCNAVTLMISILPLSGSWGSFQGYRQQLVSLSPSCSRTSSAFWRSLDVCRIFRFRLFSLNDPMKRQNPLDDNFGSLINLDLIDSYFKWLSFSRDRFWFILILFVSMVKF